MSTLIYIYIYVALAQQVHGVIRAVCVDRESTPVETGGAGSGGVGKKKKGTK